MKTFLLLLALFLATGCKTVPVAPAVVVAPAGPKTAAQIEAFRQQIEILTVQLQTQRDLADRAAAAVYGVRSANPHNPPGLAREAVDAQAAEAASALPEPSPEAKAVKDAQNARILAGELETVRAEMGQTVTENKALQASLLDVQRREAEALRHLNAATAAAEQERASAAAALQKQFNEMTARIQAAQDEARNQVMLGQVKDLNRAAAGCAGLLVLTVGLASVFGGIAGLRTVAPFAAMLLLGALMCYGLAQIVGQWWFMWAVLTAVGIVLGLAAWWIIAKQKAGVLKEAAEAKAAQFKGVLTKVVPVLDAAYEDAEQSVKDTLDQLIFKRLSDRDSGMNATERATIHELRAEVTKPTP